MVICYEAGVCGFALQRQIQGDGVVCKVIAPSLVPVTPGQRIKTDRRDASKLVGYLRAGLLTEVHPPDEQAESIRDLVCSREAGGEDLLRSRHRLLKFLLRRAMHYREGDHWTQKHLRWLSGLRFDREQDQYIFRGYLSEIAHRKDRVAELTGAIEAASVQAPYAEVVGWLRCFRGIDTITAMTIVTELFSFERFASPRQLMSYLGLVPAEHSSGDKEHKGGITKTGNRRVRRVLSQAAWHQAKFPSVSAVLKKRRQGQPQWAIDLADRAMHRLYRRYKRLVHKGKAPTVAATAVSRELSGFVWATLYLKDQAAVHYRERQVRKTPATGERQTAAEFFATT